jgi:hypothetical protein
MYRGPGLQYKIRKTTINNNTGDNYSITIPRIIAEQFIDCSFRITISGNTIMFISGCKLTIEDVKNDNLEKQHPNLDGVVIFR